jgi:putative DNA primase/helicase
LTQTKPRSCGWRSSKTWSLATGRLRPPQKKLGGVRVDILRIAVANKRRELFPPDDDYAGLEDDIALKFAELHVDDYRYVAFTGKWMIWTETRWRVETTLKAFDAARALCRDAGDADAKVVAAVEKLARSDRRIAVKLEQFDTNPWLLATPGGTVDLKTGNLLPARREDYITKQTSVTPEPRVEDRGKPPTLFLKFLDRVFDHDGELIAFVKRFLGYCLTGDTSEHCFLFLYGTGRNGKGVFCRIIMHVLSVGDYACGSPIELFLDQKNDRHPTDEARLYKVRVTIAQETPKDRAWNEAKIKNMTGGDPITARFMRQDFFDFWPECKIILAGNHKPKLNLVDEAIRARLKLIPFTVTIPADERDPELSTKLKAEGPSILRWMIDGCLEWQANGLGEPPAVTEASLTYFHDQDKYAAWLDERTERRQMAQTASGDLFKDWKAWASERDIDVGTERTFSFALQERGWRHKRTNKARVFNDLILKPKPAPHVDEPQLASETQTNDPPEADEPPERTFGETHYPDEDEVASDDLDIDF